MSADPNYIFPYTLSTVKTAILRFVFPLLLSFGLLRAGTATITFTSPMGEIGKDSTGAVLTAGFTFAVGSFGTFTPTTGNEASWQTNFTVVPSGTTAWLTDFTQYSGAAALSSNTAPFLTSNQAYVWGYNTQTIGGGTEWVLLTNSGWLFPSTVPAIPPITSWDTSDSGTSAIVGFLSASYGVGANPYLQTASISAVPEPASYAFGAGVLSLAFVAWRRKRVTS